jgi:hypothetical protein
MGDAEVATEKGMPEHEKGREALITVDHAFRPRRPVRFLAPRLLAPWRADYEQPRLSPQLRHL